jgi:glycosyltransferase involved in cell wall biosynthesis
MGLDAKRSKICVVGSGFRFLSGISTYTVRLSNALAARHEVSAILMRQLLPTRLYPGRQRVGADLTRLKYDETIAVFDGVDWFGIPSLLKAVNFLWERRPKVLILQWWTGTVLHLYLILAAAARLFGSKVIVEFHEVLDTGEARMAPVQTYVRLFLPAILALAGGFVVHSEFDRALLKKTYRLRARPMALIPLGPFDHHIPQGAGENGRDAPSGCCNILYFGVIRPYKGVEDLIRAFDSIPEDEIHQFWLTVVGETWEGWTLPETLIAQSRYRDRITFVNRYVHDHEVDAFFAAADLVALPYHRSSASGPLHIAMSCGLPVVVTRVGGLTEAAGAYTGAVWVPPHDPEAICRALRQAQTLIGQRFTEPVTWEMNVKRYESLLAEMGVSAANHGAPHAA